MPVGRWAREGLLAPSEPPGDFHAAAFTERMRQEHASGQADHHRFLFATWLAERVCTRREDRGSTARDLAAFLRHIQPLGAADLEDARLLDAGCGEGLASDFAAQLGAREVVAIDEAAPGIDLARATLADQAQVEVHHQRLCDLSYLREFDLCLCLDALQRVALPRIDVHKLVQALRPGGRLVATLRPGLDAEALFGDIELAKCEIAAQPGGGTHVQVEV